MIEDRRGPDAGRRPGCVIRSRGRSLVHRERRQPAPAAARLSSRIASAWSTSSAVVTSGGMIRTTLTYVPAVRTISLRVERLGLDPLGQVRDPATRPSPTPGLTSSSATISPRPRTSPIDGYLPASAAQAGQELVAALAGVGDEALVLDHVERRVGRRARRRRCRRTSRRGCPGGQLRHAARGRARIPDSGSPEAMPLAMTRMSGSTSQCWTANISPVRPKPGLDLVGDEQDPVLAGDLAQPRQEARRRDDVAALAEDRLDDDRRDALRVDELVEGQVELRLPVARAGVGSSGRRRRPGSSTGRPCGRRSPGSGSKAPR